MKKDRFFLALCLSFALSACSSLGLQSDKTYEDKAKTDLYKNGSVVSDKGGFDLFDGTDKKKENGNLAVNGFLWRASLDTIAFMPISTVDPFGGVITTDWHTAPEQPNERAKVNIFILDRDLRADGVRVTVFRQVRDDKGDWADAPTKPSTATALEETILTRARQMRLAQKEFK